LHIPDGYLSPATCAALYAGAAPFWYVSLRRMKRAFNTQMVPLLAVFSAFSFIIMMFNLPLPGGTTGHAVGVGIATIVLGPWASILGISIALMIQAVFFGDGGITTIGANCCNMAIIGSLATYAIYRMIAGRAALTSARRVIAAGVAGYLAINLAALAAAIEFGIQPLLFHDASGAPLYAPYPLHIAIPAMMIGHLTIAGLAEMVVSAGVLAYLQRSEPSLLKRTAPGPLESGVASANLRPLWLALAALLILTPLGILATGSAWGESRPVPTPGGLRALSSFWTAPMPQYAPPFLKSPAFGYMLSAMTGTGLILLLVLLAGWLFRTREGNATLYRADDR
jgi:cobalt/nickel transport system permease protein